MLDLIVTWINQAVLFGGVIMLASIGETISQKVGNMNLGTPGIMCVGATFGMVAAYNVGKAVENPILVILLSILFAFISAAAMGAIYSFFVVTLKTNQNVVGLVITILGVGVAKFFTGYFIKSQTGNIRARYASKLFTKGIPFLSDKLGIVSDIFFSYGFMMYLTIALAILVTYFFNKTRKGLFARAVGENPATADAAGINVNKYKYLGTIIGSGITGVAGIYCILDFKEGAWSNADVITVESFGWLAVALVIFASWKTVNLIWGSYVFGLFYWAYVYIPQMFGWKNVSDDLIQMLPYIVTIVVLVIVSVRKSSGKNGPAALGLTYFREDR